MNDLMKILVIEPSFVVREGLKTVLSRMGIGFRFEEETQLRLGFAKTLEKHQPKLLFINHRLATSVWNGNKSDTLFKDLIIIGMHFGQLSDIESARYDFMLDLCADKDSMMAQLHLIFDKSELASQSDPSESISERETEVLRLVALGFTNNEIGEKLFISVHTVMTHRKNITRKLGIKTVSGLTVYAILNKIIQSAEVRGSLK